MKEPSKSEAARQEAVSKLLSLVPQKNMVAEVIPTSEGVVVSVPLRRPGWMVPPISWVLPRRSHRRVQLDAPGAEVLALCDGQRNVEQIIETFAEGHELDFGESQLAVTQFLRELLRRGIIVIMDG